MPWLIIGSAVMTGFVLLMLVVLGLGAFYLMQERVPAGVSVAGVAVGEETMEDAEARLIRQLAAQNMNIVLRDVDRTWTVTMRDLGMTVNIDATLIAAQNAPEDSSIQPVFAIDLNQTQAGLVNLLEEINIDAVPGRDAQNGRSLEVPVLLDRLRVNLDAEVADGVIDLPMIVTEPPQVSALEAYTGERTTHIVERGQELALIAREYGVSMEDIVALNDISDPNLIYPGQELVIPAAGAFTPQNVPAAPLARGKSIVVSTGDQRIYAYQDGQLVRSHLTSTGRSETPTVLGDYNIYVKYEKTNMRGADYFLPDVPYTMYFYQGYGIHGTYWHNSFGRPMSHGCVNLPTEEAQWFFNWAEVGTLVRVI
ncbi:MAG: hypothetical protein OHK0046_10080 [Anaerolineae bacterium]